MSSNSSKKSRPETNRKIEKRSQMENFSSLTEEEEGTGSEMTSLRDDWRDWIGLDLRRMDWTYKTWANKNRELVKRRLVKRILEI